jgi:hypothetical protein
LRRAQPDLQGGELRFFDAGNADVLAYARGAGHLVALNFAPSPRRAVLPSAARVALSTRPERVPGEVVDDALELAADEGVVLSR